MTKRIIRLAPSARAVSMPVRQQPRRSDTVRSEFVIDGGMSKEAVVGCRPAHATGRHAPIRPAVIPPLGIASCSQAQVWNGSVYRWQTLCR